MIYSVFTRKQFPVISHVVWAITIYTLVKWFIMYCRFNERHCYINDCTELTSTRQTLGSTSTKHGHELLGADQCLIVIHPMAVIPLVCISLGMSCPTSQAKTYLGGTSACSCTRYDLTYVHVLGQALLQVLLNPNNTVAKLEANGSTAFIWKLCSHWYHDLR